MNKLAIFFMCGVLVSLFTVQAMAFKKTDNNDTKDSNQHISVKCHVTFTNGHQDIIFWSIQRNKLKTWSKDISGRIIEVSGYSEKQKIYKAYECVEITDKFAGARSNALDPKDKER